MRALEIAFEAITAKKKIYDELWRYYDGDHRMKYTSERLKELFQNINAKFINNWCGLVVDSVLERMQLERFVVSGNELATERLNRLWKLLELDIDADDVHLAMLVTGESYVIAWHDDDNGLEAYYNDPSMIHVMYDPDSPKKKLWAAKMWRAGDVWRMNLYTPDRVIHYQTKEIKFGMYPESASLFEAIEELGGEDGEPHNFSVVPVFHFRKERRRILSEMKDAIPAQDAVNKLLGDMMVAAEYGAFNQRYVISNAETKALKNAPNEIWSIPAGDGSGQATSVGQFEATDLTHFLKAIENQVNAISAMTRTPKHYFFQSGEVPSGEALIALEAPLNHKTAKYISRAANTWQRVGAFLLWVDGFGEVEPEDIEVVFRSPETVQPMTTSEKRRSDVMAGIPIVTVLRREGWSDQELEQMAEDKAEESARERESLAQALLEQQRRFDQERGGGRE